MRLDLFAIRGKRDCLFSRLIIFFATKGECLKFYFLMMRLCNVTSQDVNDERPVFSEARYEVNVTEGTEGGTSLLSVSASDDDIGENADLMYSVEGGVVSVSGESGEVQLVMVLDHEESNTLEIQV